MPIHNTEIEIAGNLADCRIEYIYVPGDPGCYSALLEECREATEEDWDFIALWLNVVGGYERCDLLLQFVDDDAIIDEIKVGWDE